MSVVSKLLEVDAPASINVAQVCDSSKVTDHHAVVPTQSAVNINLPKDIHHQFHIRLKCTV